LGGGETRTHLSEFFYNVKSYIPDYELIRDTSSLPSSLSLSYLSLQNTDLDGSFFNSIYSSYWSIYSPILLLKLYMPDFIAKFGINWIPLPSPLSYSFFLLMFIFCRGLLNREDKEKLERMERETMEREGDKYVAKPSFSFRINARFSTRTNAILIICLVSILFAGYYTWNVWGVIDGLFFLFFLFFFNFLI
jgi:hypothetical protein